jgi:hypothetical protein
MTHGALKQRNNYNYYSAYPNEFFARLFHDYLHTGRITQHAAGDYLRIPPSTLSSKYTAWVVGGMGTAGTRDGRGAKRKMSTEDEATVISQLHTRMDEGSVTQNGHLVDFIMTLYPDWHPLSWWQGLCSPMAMACN